MYPGFANPLLYLNQKDLLEWWSNDPETSDFSVKHQRMHFVCDCLRGVIADNFEDIFDQFPLSPPLSSYIK